MGRVTPPYTQLLGGGEIARNNGDSTVVSPNTARSNDRRDNRDVRWINHSFIRRMDTCTEHPSYRHDDYYLTGVLAAAINTRKKIDYIVGAKGIAKKATILLIVAMGHLADEVLGTDMIMAAITYAYLANEGLSIIENAEAAGVPVPNVVKMAYQTIGEKGKIKIGGDSHEAKKS